MEIKLTPEQAEFVQKQVIRGRYNDADEVISCALKLLQGWEQQYGHGQWLAETRKKVEVGLTQVKQGESLDLETVTERLNSNLDQGVRQRLNINE